MGKTQEQGSANKVYAGQTDNRNPDNTIHPDTTVT